MILALLLAGVVGIQLIRLIVQQDLESQLLRRGALAAHAIQFAVESSATLGGIQRFVSSVGAEEDFDLVIVVAGDPTRVIASTELNLVGQPLQTLPYTDIGQDLQAALSTRKPHHAFQQLDGNIFDYSAPVLISNIMDAGRPLGDGALMLHLRTTTLRNAIRQTVYTMSTLLIFFLITIGVLVQLLVNHYVIVPQRSLLATVTARQRGDKSLASISGDNELAQLGSAFNEMLTSNDRVEQMKNEFVSTVSHELRTPLTSIRGAIGLVLGTMARDLPEQGQHLLEMANRNSERLSMLINDILDLEKIAAGRLTFDFRSVNLADLARKAIQANESYAASHAVKLKLLTCPAEAIVRGDEHRLLQVFANLLSNAIKFSPPKGGVEVSVKEHGEQFRVRVIDHGRGIPEAFRQRIFQRFAQADSSDSRDKGGTGLGLSIVKAIVERHNGHVGFVSQAESGTEFYFDLPRYNQHPLSAATHHSGMHTLGTGHRPLILHIEDDPDIIQFTRALVENIADYSPARDLAEARRLLEDRNFELIILDIRLPDGSGLTLLDALDEQQPVLIFADQELDLAPYQAHIPVLIKSRTSNEQLLTAIEQLLAR